MSSVLATSSNTIVSQLPTYNAFLSCPIEIWNTITTTMGLSFSDKAALALTCKAALAILGREAILVLRQPNQRTELYKLLFLIQDQFPRHYLCAECVFFHFRETAYSAYAPRDLVFNNYVEVLYTTMKNIAAKHDTPLLMAGALYIKDFGWATTLMAQKVEGRLLLDVWYSLGVSNALQADPKSITDIPTCQHLQNAGTLLERFRELIECAPKLWKPMGEVSKTDNVTFSCPFCPSEHRMTIRKNDSVESTDTRFALDVQRYIDLGTLSSSGGHSKEWFQLTRPRPAGLVAYESLDLERRSSIASRWPGNAPSPENMMLPVLD